MQFTWNQSSWRLFSLVMILTMADGILAQANINIIKVKVIIILFSLYDVDCCCSGDVIVEAVLDDLVIKTSLSSPLVISLIVVVLELQGELIDNSAQCICVKSWQKVRLSNT